MKYLIFSFFLLLTVGAGCTRSPSAYTPSDKPDEIIENGMSGPDHGDIFVDEITTEDGETIPQGDFNVGACIVGTDECENMTVFIFGEYVEAIEVDNETIYADSSECHSTGCTFMLDGDEWVFIF